MLSGLFPLRPGPSQRPHAAIPGLTGRHSEWQHLETPTKQPGRVVIVDGCSPPPPHPPNPLFQFLITLCGRVAQPDKWEPGRTQPRGQRPVRVTATNHSVFISLHRLRWASGLSAGKARGGGGDPKSFPPGQATPWHCGGQGMEHSES